MPHSFQMTSRAYKQRPSGFTSPSNIVSPTYRKLRRWSNHAAFLPCQVPFRRSADCSIRYRCIAASRQQRMDGRPSSNSRSRRVHPVRGGTWLALRSPRSSLPKQSWSVEQWLGSTCCNQLSMGRSPSRRLFPSPGCGEPRACTCAVSPTRLGIARCSATQRLCLKLRSSPNRLVRRQCSPRLRSPTHQDACGEGSVRRRQTTVGDVVRAHAKSDGKSGTADQPGECARLRV